MEYCEEGQLDQWLAVQRQAVSDDVMENLFRFSRDIAHGMQYLASKKVDIRAAAIRHCSMK